MKTAVRLLLASIGSAVLATHSLAAPQPAAATRAELTRWLEGLRAAGAEVAAPLVWRYQFQAPGTANLESLSVELVGAGYSIEGLRPSAAAGAELAMTRVELLTPTSLERRNRDLALLARKHGARYVGVDVAFSAR